MERLKIEEIDIDFWLEKYDALEKTCEEKFCQSIYRISLKLQRFEGDSI